MTRLLELFSWEKIQYVFSHPQESPRETVLLAGIIIIIPLIVLAFILLFLLPKEARPKKRLSKKTWTWIFAIVVTLFIISSLALLAYSSNPTFCKLCHQKEYKALKTSLHKKTACLSCHQRGGVLGWKEFKLETTNMLEAQIRKAYFTSKKSEKSNSFLFQLRRAKIEDSSCLKCHKEITKKTSLAYGIKMSHVEPLKAGFRCTDCHNTVAHKNVVYQPTTPSMDKCLDCHDGKTASARCNLCHTKDIGKKPSTKIENYPKVHLPPPTTCRGCHSMEKCTACHGVEMPHPSDWTEPGKITHAKPAAFERKQVCFKCHQSTAYCNSCHRFPGHAENWKSIHGSGGLASEKSCMSCHTKEMSPVFCGLCH